MTEEGKKHFNLYKYLCFPWGCFFATPFWYGIVQVIDRFLSKLSFIQKTGETVGVPWWCSWVLFGVGEILLFIISGIYSYTIPRGSKSGHNIFILISPEYHEDDKYITNDFYESFERHAKKSIDDLHVIVPATIKRDFFIRTIKNYKRKHKIYWTTARWEKRHKRLRGILYITGTLKRRSSKGKEKLVFNLSPVIGYNNLNPKIAPLLKEELKRNFPNSILVDRQFELEEFEAVSDRFATFSEYLIGWAHLVSGNIALAYKMHLDIYTNNKQSFFKRGGLKNLPKLLKAELDTILVNCMHHPKDFVLACAKKVEELFPGSDSATIRVPRFLIMTSDDDSFTSNLTRAQALLNEAKLNSTNRSVIHANRAYIWLLKGDYQRAESEYRTVLKDPEEKLIEEIIRYCDGQIKNGCSKEQPTAYYVKALMLWHTKPQEPEFRNAIKLAKKRIPANYEYYHNKLTEMEEDHQKTKNKRK